MLLLIDFEKAFDSVSHKFVFKALNFLNFGPSIMKWIKLFYSNCMSSVFVNGNATKQFKLGRGCRQGDPLSPYIFLICAEMLGCLIRKNESISGIVIDNIECKISQYADDSTVILDGSNRSLLQTLKTLDLFERLSGLQVNEEKTNVVYIGSLANRMPNPNITQKKLKWVKDGKFKALGVNFFNTFRRNGRFKLQYGHGGSFKSSPSLVKKKPDGLGKNYSGKITTNPKI